MSSSHLQDSLDQFATLGLDAIHPKKLLRSLGNLLDPRARRGIRHPLSRILVITICAVIAGVETLVENAECSHDTGPKQLASCNSKAPHATIIAGVLRLLVTQSFGLFLSAWAKSLSPETGTAKTLNALAMDGCRQRSLRCSEFSRTTRALVCCDRLTNPCGACSDSGYGENCRNRGTL
ncbi:transposase family protein [Glutamicibacter sp. NPDC087344]|uniref:transposase family protein n=1 Tax=Glutamicibacter sp. NPDC087344 TaxID=3363994 RepID=UPI003814BC3D